MDSGSKLSHLGCLERTQWKDFQEQEKHTPAHNCTNSTTSQRNNQRFVVETSRESSFTQEACILLQLGLQSIVPQGINKGVSEENASMDILKPPPQGFLKFNIYGASKGNPGLASCGGVTRDEQGCIKEIFHSHLGKATNNMAELMALEQCLEILVNLNSHNVIIKEDSELIIKVAKKMCNGTALEKVLKNWRLSQVFHRIYTHLQIVRTVKFVHVERKENMLVDCLANEGVISKGSGWHVWESITPGKLCDDCIC